MIILFFPFLSLMLGSLWQNGQYHDRPLKAALDNNRALDVLLFIILHRWTNCVYILSGKFESGGKLAVDHTFV